MSVAAPPRRGRPRSAAIDQAILDAAFSLLHERGYAATAMDAIAARAGVSKATIYRRFRGKPDLAVAALDSRLQLGSLPDSGDTRADLVTLISRFQHLMVEVMGMRIFGTLLVEEARHPDLLEAFRTRVVAVRRAAMGEIVTRGIARGELRPDLDAETLMDLVSGAVIVRRIIAGRPPAGYPERLVAALWPGLVASPG